MDGAREAWSGQFPQGRSHAHCLHRFGTLRINGMKCAVFFCCHAAHCACRDVFIQDNAFEVEERRHAVPADKPSLSFLRVSADGSWETEACP